MYSPLGPKHTSCWPTPASAHTGLSISLTLPCRPLTFFRGSSHTPCLMNYFLIHLMKCNSSFWSTTAFYLYPSLSPLPLLYYASYSRFEFWVVLFMSVWPEVFGTNIPWHQHWNRTCWLSRWLGFKFESAHFYSIYALLMFETFNCI